jgi:hypothetical protein
MSGTAKENERAQNAKPPEAFSGRFREAESVVLPDNNGDATGRANDDRLQTELAGSKIDAASTAASSKDERSTTKDPGNKDSSKVLKDMAEAHEEQPGEHPISHPGDGH